MTNSGSTASRNRRQRAYTRTRSISSSGAVTTRQPASSAAYVQWPMPYLQRHGLGAPRDLGVPVVAQRLDRGPRERVVLPKQPVEGLLVAEPAVPQHGEQARQVLEDGAVLQELGGDLAVAAAGDRHELPVAQQLADAV